MNDGDLRLYINGEGMPPLQRVYQLLNGLSLDRAPREVQQAAVDEWLNENEPSHRMLESLIDGGWVVPAPAS